MYYILTFLLTVVLLSTSKGAEYNSRIIGGRVAKNGEFPYMVSLQYKNQHMCGGSIITRFHVLTAAHCFFFENGTALNTSLMSIMAGRKMLFSNKLSFQVNLTDIRIHENYFEEDRDIAVVKVEIPFPFDLQQLPVSIIPLETKEIINGTICTIVGWGTEEFEVNVASNNLKAANVTVLDFNTCQKIYSNKSFEIYDDLICASDHTNDACQGDSGGPLICNKKLSGIITGGIKCADINYPGLYTSIYVYRQWIYNIINDTYSKIPTPNPDLAFPNPPVSSNNPNSTDINHGSTTGSNDRANDEKFSTGKPGGKHSSNRSSKIFTNYYLLCILIIKLLLFTV